MNDLGHSSYKPLRGPRTLEDMEWAADCIARQVKIRIDRDPDFSVTTEAFRDTHDDYADWWASGLNTRKQKQNFTNELLLLLKHRGIEEVEDNTFT